MGNEIKLAAQYIRMSTDRQELSPIVQKAAIAAFARASDSEIICSYEDEGKSGLQLLNRPRLRQPLRDVSDGPTFTQILVYDVSRWGRFQDADAAAYYEYHCRLHGVQVLYVSEAFANDNAPTTVLLKSMRRVMAAEYSRDIAIKSRAGQERVVSMGFQMGKLPAFGYRRCSVSADGSRRAVLARGQCKSALTDRIEWTLAPDAELAMVRRICTAYGSGLDLDAIAGLVSAEGWRDQRGGIVKPRGLRAFLENEVLIGNFVWGRRSKGGKVLRCSPTRMDGSVPRIIDDATWNRVQDRLKIDARAEAARGSPPGTPERTGSAPAPKQLSLPLRRTDRDGDFRRMLGEPRQLQCHAREFGRALCAELLQRGFPAAFDPRTIVLTFWGARVRIRLMWPCDPTSWLLDRSRSATDVSRVLVARMAALNRPLDFLLVPAHPVPTAILERLQVQLPSALRRYRCADPEELVKRLTHLGFGKQASTPVPPGKQPHGHGTSGAAQ